MSTVPPLEYFQILQTSNLFLQFAPKRLRNERRLRNTFDDVKCRQRSLHIILRRCVIIFFIT